MALAKVLENLEGIPEDIQKEYIEKDGKFYLDVDDSDLKAAKAKVDEFRTNNINLMKDVEVLKNQQAEWETKMAEAEKEKQKKIDKKMLDEEGIDELLNEKTKRMRQDFQNQIDGLQTKITESDQNLSKAKATLATIKIDNAIQLEVGKVGSVRQGYMEDIISLGKRIFSLDDSEEPVALDSKGGKMVGKDGVTPLTIKEWATALPVEKAAYFEASEGAGAPGSGKGKRQGQDIKKIEDPVERMKAIRKRNKTK